MPSKSPKRAINKGFLTMSLEVYFQLVDWAGRQIKSGKKERIARDVAPIVERIGYLSELWLDRVKRFGKILPRAAAKPES
jgi:hypothetical protein